MIVGVIVFSIFILYCITKNDKRDLNQIIEDIINK
jgi:hypothetical protein